MKRKGNAVRSLSLRTRLVLGLLALAAAGLIAADIATYTALKSFLFQQTDNTLEADHHVADRFLRRAGQGPQPGSQPGPGGLPPGLFVQIRSLSGQVLYNPGIGHVPGTKAPSPPRIPARIRLRPPSPGQPDAVRYFTAPAQAGGGSYRVRASIDPNSNKLLIVGTSLHDLEATLDRLLLIELLVTGVVLVGVLLLGLWVVRLGLRPLAAMGRTADAIAAGELSRRVEPAEPRTEVGRLGLALNAMLGRIEDSDRRLRRFVADASHELRTPLTAIRAYAELFTRGADRRPQDLARAMSGIERESERMSTMVEDLLLLARLDEGRPLEQKPVQLPEVVGEAVETAHTVDPGRPIEFHAEPALVLGDRDRLRQIVDNLLGNVRAHTPAGTPVRVTVSSSNGSAFVEVEDAGPGLEAAEAQRVFERFYRSDPSRARGSGGVGLGLSIVAAVAAAHGGSASVRSEPGKGSAFRIELPLLDE